MNTLWVPLSLTVVLGYLLGSINSAILLSRLFGHEDIRKFGSGNAGVTNMLRTYGAVPAILTVLGDMLKAILAVILARLLFNVLGVQLVIDPGILAGLFVMLGHLFPLYFQFRGGKGMMPAFGIILLINPLAFIILLVVAIGVFIVSKTMSLVSVIAAAMYPIVTLVILLIQHANPWIQTLFALAYSFLVLYSHRDNIKRLLDGTEKPIIPDKKG
ncbi:MAG: glycerol-3-phosphate 1-O-acyltransferase PlsY [Clostridiaceae bacterium]|nr:glycerol-3-phosphate 1-O-acyltransferase PlsY [Clostridiaceae bacterium]